MTAEVSIKSPSSNGKSTLYGWLICGLGAIFYCYEYLLRISPNVMMEDLMRVYQIDAAMLGNLAAFYYYAYTPMQLPVGVLMDRFGPRRLLMLASLLCAVGTYLFAESGHLLIAQIGRFFVGFGSAFAFVGVLKLASLWLPPNRFAMIAGLATALGMGGAMVGQIALAQLVNSIGWHQTIIGSAMIGVVLAGIIFAALPKDSGPLATAFKQHEPATFSQLFKGLGKLLANPQIWLVGLIGCLLYLPTSVFAELWGVTYIENVFGFSKLGAAGAVSMIYLGWMIGGPIVGFISDKLGLRRMPILIGSFVAALLITFVLYVPGLSKVTIYFSFFIFGAFSSVENIVFAIGREIGSAKLAGTAIALMNMLVMMGGVIFQPTVGAILDWQWAQQADQLIVNGVRNYSIDSYKMAMAILPIGLIISALIAFFVQETHAKIKE